MGKSTKQTKTDTAKNRTAIVFVHGQGEQTPLKDLRELVYSVWQTDERLTTSGEDIYWSVPNPQANLNDTRRLTTMHSKNGKRYDFHEFYWADLMVGNRLRHVWSWFSTLLIEPESNTPEKLKDIRRFIYAVSMILGFWVFGFALYSALLIATQDQSFPATAESWERVKTLGVFVAPLDMVYLLVQAIAVGIGIAGIGLLFWVVFLSKFRWFKKTDTEQSFWSRTFYSRGVRKTATDEQSLTADATTKVIQAWLFIALVLLSVLFVFPNISPTDISAILVLAAVYLLALIRGSHVNRFLPLSLYIAAFAIICNLFFLKDSQLIPFDGIGIGPIITITGWILFSFLWLQLFWEIGRLISKRGKYAKWVSTVMTGVIILVVTLTVLKIHNDLTAITLIILCGLVLGVSIAGTVAFLALSSRRFLLPVMGDSARYLSKQPENIMQRQMIQKRGIDLLSQISVCGKYDRIVVLAHSLGSVVAYDVLNAYWGKRHDFFSNDEKCDDALKYLEAKIPPLITAYRAWQTGLLDSARSDLEREYKDARASYRRAQQMYADTLKSVKAQATYTPIIQQSYASHKGGSISEPWLIDNFVTIGSPLGYGHYLHGDNNSRTFMDNSHCGNSDDDRLNNFKERKRQRELPTCPPTGEMTEDACKISYKKSNTNFQTPQHGAVFGPVKWTNLFFPVPVPRLASGDVIGGAVVPHYGSGIVDVDLALPEGMEKKFLHTLYWKTEFTDGQGGVVPDYITELRKALDL